MAAAASVAVVIIIVASIYVAAPSIFRGSGSSGGPTASVTIGATVSVGSSSSESSAGAPAAAEAWTTYHGDNNRTGYYPVANFTSVTPGWTSPTLDGWVFAEPLVYGGDVFVATENNSVYALSAQNGSLVWMTNLGPPVDADLLPCGNIEPVTGITGTPVIDPSTGTLYVVAFSDMHHTLWALKTSDGAVVFQRSATPPGFNDTTQQERTALTLANGMVYIGYGGLAGDCAQYWGWEVGIPASGTGAMVYYKVPTAREGAIWAPDGASVDASGNIYVATGNAASTTTFDHGDSVIKLSPTLQEEGYFAPTDWPELAATDTDLGSLAPVFVGPDTLFQIGKQGIGYLLNSSQLGGIGGQEFQANVCDESFGGTAFVSPIVFVPCINGLFELRVSGTSFSTAVAVSGFNSGPPIVTGGVVWTVDDSTAMLYGLSATTGHEAYSFSLGSVEHFTTPAAGDGQIFVAAANKIVSFALG